jgi:hypothetical protein
MSKREHGKRGRDKKRAPVNSRQSGLDPRPCFPLPLGDKGTIPQEARWPPSQIMDQGTEGSSVGFAAAAREEGTKGAK